MSRLHARNPRSPPTTHNLRQPPSTSCDPPTQPHPTAATHQTSSPRPTFHFMPTLSLSSFFPSLLSTSSTPCLPSVHQGRMHRVHSFCLPRSPAANVLICTPPTSTSSPSSRLCCYCWFFSIESCLDGAAFFSR
ncbi:hypothetical protein WH47_11600 [Habropoda laboriosa]|uniref:Uncharacterized protein n=1 Tax=Habropoda laboriosa TaxID=597456 RepID=A0A0L7R9I9_9HYME|nr:hypothetical protein WH47_11600 [Habropoda laboriosa]